MTTPLVRLSGHFAQAVTVGLATAADDSKSVALWLFIAGFVWLFQIIDVFIQADT